MNILLKASSGMLSSSIQITGSKSESNRLLLLQALYPQITVENVSDSDDSSVMTKALNSDDNVIDIHHAGTAMRFLTAYFAVTPGKEVVLTGSARMKERPIGILVEALKSLGAKIEYIENEGYPPLKITGTEIICDKVTLKANISSQYITALLLVAAKLKNGLEISLDGEITSLPYLQMTLNLLNQVGISAVLENNVIRVKPLEQVSPIKLIVESDWSSASYFYSLVALAQKGTEVSLSSYVQKSLQGDSALSEIYKELGVETIFSENTITLKNTGEAQKQLSLNLVNTPDIAQTIAVTCFGLGTACHLTGLHTLKIKETDRLEALKTELTKLGAVVIVTNDSLTLEPSVHINSDVAINTYNDHRMAMAFAPLALKTSIVINDAGVVSKSYPSFWDDMQQVGIAVKTL
ncbi:3-phosphoshikimate 1-carboxyvinyltransferase [Flavobacterium beibuense F44-8]|uniref:3-phosphoshikimate 1-carboxyvinyltransferase n=1 Tax=Flavobacterium beibuense F44-8 TaxID=1406840 RepID=A0A0A2LKG6_9FLAO|nr:3-phosphoshikimate 1-carboxyvinyltransferase [Flavobacterium beibuense]KGO80419.1 3-phosphoshikimate 1-carboxyvinyltransferase [Flavobacterium beibuense F44-8]